MTEEFRKELRKALREIGLDLLQARSGDGWRSSVCGAGLLFTGAFAGALLGHAAFGEHWIAYWVSPVVGAGLLQSGVFSLARHRDDRV